MSTPVRLTRGAAALRPVGADPGATVQTVITTTGTIEIRDGKRTRNRHAATIPTVATTTTETRERPDTISRVDSIAAMANTELTTTRMETSIDTIAAEPGTYDN